MIDQGRVSQNSDSHDQIGVSVDLTRLMFKLRTSLLFLVIAFAVSFNQPDRSFAQTTSPSPSPPASANPSNVNGQALQTIVVQGASEQTVNPLERPVSSIYGTDLPVTDIPRSVSSVTAAQLQQQNITSIAELSQLTPSSVNLSRWGITGTPTIRGDLAEVYVNGQRKLTNQNAFSPSFTGVESVDILKGPASVVDGPGSQTGGYVNFVTKAPYFDRMHGTVYLDLGTYVPGGQSYFNQGWGIDIGGPLIANQLAYRFSYEGTGGQSYYHRNGVKNDRDDFYGSITYTPSRNLSININAGYLNTDVGELDGINRPTQQLIDSRSYYTGVAISPFATPPARIAGSIYYQPNTTGPGGFGAVLYPTGTTKIYPFNTIVSPLAIENVQDLYAQMIITLNLSDSLTITNRTYGESVDRYDRTAYQYAEYVPHDVVFENRTEISYHWDGQICGVAVANDLLTGFSFRYQDSLSYGEFQNEYFNNYDVTQNPRTFVSPFYQNPQPFSSMVYVGHGFFANPGTSRIGPNGILPSGIYLTNGNSNRTHLFDAGLFLQDRIELAKQWALLIGVRGDYLGASASDPVPYKDNVQAPGTKNSDSVEVGNPTISASLNYKPTSWLTSYFTFNETYGLDEASVYETGGVPQNPNGSGGITKASMKNKSVLLEGGFKFNLLENKLFIGLDGFYQRRASTDQFGHINNIEVRGMEAEATYQPNKNFSVSANFTWSEANYINYTPIQSTQNLGDTYAAGFPVQPGVVGTGVGSPNFTANALPAGAYRLNGFPNLIFNGYATYVLNCGLGVSLGIQAESSQRVDFDNKLKIPSQYQLNASIFYRQPCWEVRVNISNLTDQRNWSVTDGILEGNDLLMLNQPLAVSGRITIRF
jgi:outer membrane receptor protein involved in Fe transport